jgi:crotonobetaine/carnitine-CoA ligase
MMVRTLLLQPPCEDDACNDIREVLYFLPIDTAEKEEFERRFDTRILNSYGSTESLTWVITDFSTGKRKWPSVGRVGLGYEAKIVDDNGAEVPVGTIGEIAIKGVPGRTIMKGYFRDPEHTAQTILADGWMLTGDKGYVDEEGFYYFADRKANMIKRAGENISTTEVEEVLLGHEGIKEAAVIGVPDSIRDQAVKAFVVPEEGAALDAAEIKSYCAGALAAFKVPSIVEVRASLPHTCSMKIEKKLLR